MSEEKQPDPTKTGEIAQEIVRILAREDSDTRRRAMQAAMMLLGEAPVKAENLGSELETSTSVDNDSADLTKFFDRGEKLKPSDCAYLCAAYHYSVYGNAAFSLDDLRAIATEAGVVLPDRLDMTLKMAGKDGKKLFQATGRNAYKPTASAGVLFKEQWGVKPGKRKKETAVAKD